MKIVCLTREQLRRDVNEAGSSLALGRIQAAPFPVPAHTQTHGHTDTDRHMLPAQLSNVVLLPLLGPAGFLG